MSRIRPIIKISGGKAYLWQFVTSHFPQHDVYIECCVGGGSCLLNKEKSPVEIASDINHNLINAWKFAQSGNIEELKWIPYKKDTFLSAKHYLENTKFREGLEEQFAIAYIVKCRMSRGGLGRDFAKSNRKRGNYENGDENAWQTFVQKEIYKIRDRIKDVQFFCCDLIQMLKLAMGLGCSLPVDTNIGDLPFGNNKKKQYLVYIDTPYLHETRVSKNLYEYEMTNEQHEEMLDFITMQPTSAKFCVSGYSSKLYDIYLKDWNCFKKEIVNHSSQQKVKQKKIECIWCNY